MKTRGFTLIEILVALTVVAIALAAASRASSSSIAASDEARLRLLAGWVAENRLAEHQALNTWPEFGTQEGRQAQAGESYLWSETTSSTPNVQFRRLEIRVAHESSPQHALARLTGLLPQPSR